MMTFEDFRDSRIDCANLDLIVPDDMVEPDGRPRPGMLYLGCLRIDRVQEWWPADAKAEGRWHLLIERSEFITDDLDALERRLHDWAVRAGYKLETINDLITEYGIWNKREHLDLGSADEHLFDESLTADQHNWLHVFCARWEQVAQREDVEDAMRRRLADESL